MNEEKIVNGLKWYIGKLEEVTDFQGFADWKNVVLTFLVDVYGEESQQRNSLFQIGYFEMYTPPYDVSKLKHQAKTLLEGLVVNIGFAGIPQSKKASG